MRNLQIHIHQKTWTFDFCLFTFLYLDKRFHDSPVKIDALSVPSTNMAHGPEHFFAVHGELTKSCSKSEVNSKVKG